LVCSGVLVLGGGGGARSKARELATQFVVQERRW